MPCYHPWVPGAVNGTASRPLACGQCHGCRLERSRQWAVRCMHEASLYESNSFVTLTYRDAGFSLCYSDFQLFMKRLRARVSRARKIRYFMCGEYGEITSRPHFHACLFNYQFPDLVYHKKSGAGEKIYTSELLDEIWSHGHCYVGNVSFHSAAYVARYVMKKQLGDGERQVEIVDPDTGEIRRREKEFGHMSLKPGIGEAWLRRYKSDVYPHGRVVVNGVEAAPPKHYDRLFKRWDEAGYKRLIEDRQALGRAQFSETLPSRLDARSTVAKARIGLLKRSG